MLNRIIKFITGKKGSKGPAQFSVDQLQIDLSRVSRNAIKVVDMLQSAGYSAYIVGGGVRDLLLNLKPKDFDVATNATPEQVRQVFRSAMIIGRRFRIVHVRFGREIIEVTTFRAHHQESSNAKDAKQSDHGLLLLDNVYGDIESDAFRRDFTVNALYLDPNTRQIIDFAEGIDDLKQRQLRIIGEAEARYREDPVRMLRAVRFAAKLGFALEPGSERCISTLAPLLAHIPPARMFEEVLKLFLSGSATACFNLLRQYGLFYYLFPGTDDVLKHNDPVDEAIAERVAINTDKRIRSDQRVTPAFIFAAFLWLPLHQAVKKLLSQGISPQDALQRAGSEVISKQLTRTAIPKRFLIPLREIWALQWRLPKRDGAKAFALLEHPRFRAAYDFLLLRGEAGEDLDGLGHWWTQFQTADNAAREEMVKGLDSPIKRKARKRRPKKRTGANTGENTGPQDPQE
jgi:poly(A) polymerase